MMFGKSRKVTVTVLGAPLFAAIKVHEVEEVAPLFILEARLRPREMM